MADVYRRQGMAHRRSTFSLFVRSLPARRGYLVAAGLDDALSWLAHLRFDAEACDAIASLGIFEPGFIGWLAELRFTGSVRAVAEGTIVFADEPILEVDAPLAEAQLAETFLLNQITLQTTLATKAARCRHAAAGRAVVDFGLRRTQGVDAGMKLARVGRLVGLSGTSNVAGSDRYGIAASGTMAHSFVQAFVDERDAFRAFAAAYHGNAVLLVDTYDTDMGIERAIDVALELRRDGRALRGIRLDSGDLAELSRHARDRLDREQLHDVEVFASGGLDEYEIHRLVHEEQAPIDGFGVGSALAVSDDAPVLDSVYKLVTVDGRPVRKTSTGKQTWPGAKQVWRTPDHGDADVLALADEPAPSALHRALSDDVMRDGRRIAERHTDLAAANSHFEREWQSLPADLKDIEAPRSHRVRASERLRALTRHIDEQHRPK